jgi:transcription antitermination factor NusG
MGKADTRYGEARGPSPRARAARLSAVRRRDRDGAGWCIVRTNSRHTLTLAKSLSEAGVEAWTPQRTVKRRLPRGRRLVASGYREHDEPLVPSFVFVRACHLPDLVRELSLPSSAHARFAIFRLGDRVPIVGELEIERLRRSEDDAKPRAMRRTVAIGHTVKPTEGAFAGLEGVVEFVQGGNARVSFGGTLSVTVKAWQLLENAVQAENIGGRHDRQRVTGMELVD